LTNNCQNFVDDALKSISCKKTWLKDGPIVNFLDHVTRLECGVNKMSFWDEEDQQHTFQNYDDFKEFCRKNSKIQELVNNRQYYESDQEKAEYLQILKAIERGFQIQLPNDQKEQNSNLLFPIQDFEKVGQITAFPAGTIFAPKVEGGEINATPEELCSSQI